MKSVLFIRHAKSSWDNPELTDQERPLNARGRRDAPFMASRLKKMDLEPHVIISSPAVRANTTAQIFAETIGYPKGEVITGTTIYEANINDIIKLLSELENSFESVFLFGHNPTMTNIANFFSEEFIQNVATCGMFMVHFDVQNWSEINRDNGRLVFYDYPKRHLGEETEI